MDMKITLTDGRVFENVKTIKEHVADSIRIKQCGEKEYVCILHEYVQEIKIGEMTSNTNFYHRKQP